MNSNWFKSIYYFFIDFSIFISNIWKFRRELWEHRWWDYTFPLQMLYRSVSIMERGMHNGLEVEETRNKKIQKMQRLLELLDNKINDRYIELAERDLGYEMILKPFEFEEIDNVDENGEKLYRMVDVETDEEKKLNQKIFDRSREIEETQWKEIWRILEGQDIGDYNNQMLDILQNKKVNSTNRKSEWNDWFDGTGLRGWWD